MTGNSPMLYLALSTKEIGNQKALYKSTFFTLFYINLWSVCDHKYTIPIITDTQHRDGILTVLMITEVSHHYLVVEPQMWDNHSVLRQCARLVRAYHSRRAQSLDRVQILYQAVFLCHSLCPECQWKLCKATSCNNTAMIWVNVNDQSYSTLHH